MKLENPKITTKMNNLYPIQIISEENYETTMSKEIEPLLKTIVESGYIGKANNKKLYYESYISKHPICNIFISHGFTESSEKYKEMIYYFLNQNYNVFILDHHGHGKSYRLVNDHSITHIHRFEDYVNDLKFFFDTVVQKSQNSLPNILYAHSMGGMIGANYLVKYPQDFDKAIFNAPMFEINTGKIPNSIAHLITSIKNLTGQHEKRLFNHAPFNHQENFEASCATSYKRYHYYFEKCKYNKNYQNSSASYAWLKQSLQTTKKIIRTNQLSKIKIPVILFQAENDSFVLPKGHDTFINAIEEAKLIKVPNSKHEIYMSTNDVLTPYLSKIFEFIEA